MDATPNRGSVLNIEHLHARVLAPLEHPCLESLGDKSQEHLAAELPGALAARLGTYFSSGDPSLWFLRRLDFQLDLPFDGVSRTRSAAWASPFVRALDRALSYTGNPELIHFPSEAAYLASFLCDLASGSAWSKWYYSRFEGLRHLPASAAIRTCICGATEISFAALKSLTSRALSDVLRSLSPFDCRLVLEVFSLGAPSESLAEAFRAVGERMDGRADIEQRNLDTLALEFFLSAARTNPQIAAFDLSLAARAWAQVFALSLGSSLQNGLFLRSQALRRALSSDDSAGSFFHLMADAAKRGSNHAVEIAAQYLLSPGDPREATGESSTQASTPFGGVFLLLSIMDRIDWETVCHAWPDAERCSALALTKLTILLKCFGRENARDLFLDRVLRWALGIPKDITAEELRHWQGRLKSEDLMLLKKCTAEWIDNEADVDSTEVRLVRLNLGRRKLVLAPRSVTTHWLDVIYGEQNVHLLSDEQLLRFSRLPESLSQARKCGGRRAAKSYAGSPGLILPPCDSAKLLRELRFLSLGKDFCANQEVGFAFSVGARNILAGLVARIRALALSSPLYLRDNLLLCRATATVEQDRVSVHMAAPPLHIALASGGFSKPGVRLQDGSGRFATVPVHWEE